jgi:hypothetical protein
LGSQGLKTSQFKASETDYFKLQPDPLARAMLGAVVRTVVNDIGHNQCWPPSNPAGDAR